MKHPSVPFLSTLHACALVVCTLLMGPGPTQAETEEKLEKTFAVAPGGELVVEVDFGSIEITTNASDQVSIQVVRRISRGAKADEETFLQERPVLFSQDGTTVTVRSQAKKNRPWKGKQRMEAQYTISAPARFNARLKTSGGGIDVRDLRGSLKANTSGGELKFARVQGPLSGHTSGGGIAIADCQGAIDVHTSGGGINVHGGSGSLEGRTSGGSVAVKGFNGAVTAETSGGDIHLEDVAGKIEGSTSGGSIAAALPTLKGAVKLETSGGGVVVRLPSESAFDLDAATSGGSASSELPLTRQDKKSRSHLKGAVNGGGAPILLRSSGGSVQIKKLSRG